MNKSVKSISAGLPVNERKLAKQKPGKQLTGNQWRNSPKQIQLMKNYFDLDSETYSNGYQSALKAGYSTHYARNITSVIPKWISEFVDTAEFTPQHISLALQSIATKPNINSKSPDDTRVKALDVLARVKALGTYAKEPKDKGNTFVYQPILGGVTAKPLKMEKVIDQTD
ncbi:MAG: hypothetical protein ACR2FM_01580 [Candidatus Saccharimonadales bacterium]